MGCPTASGNPEDGSRFAGAGWARGGAGAMEWRQEVLLDEFLVGVLPGGEGFVVGPGRLGIRQFYQQGGG